MKRLPTLIALCVWVLWIPHGLVCAQPAPDSCPVSAEPGRQAKIAQLQAVRQGLERQAREATGYHESLRQMKIVKIDHLIARLKNGEDVPQSKIDKVIGHMLFPLYEAPGN